MNAMNISLNEACVVCAPRIFLLSFHYFLFMVFFSFLRSFPTPSSVSHRHIHRVFGVSHSRFIVDSRQQQQPSFYMCFMHVGLKALKWLNNFLLFFSRLFCGEVKANKKRCEQTKRKYNLKQKNIWRSARYASYLMKCMMERSPACRCSIFDFNNTSIDNDR